MEKFNHEKFDKIVTIAVDIQNDFCPGGKLAVNSGDEIIAPINKLIDYTRQNNGTVIFTSDQHPKDTPHFEKWPIHCVAGTRGADFHHDLDIQEGDIFINKGMGQTDGYSGFEGRTKQGYNIEQFITPTNNERIAILIGGLATDYCVFETTIDTLKTAERVREKQIGSIAVFAVLDTMRAVNINPNDGDTAKQKIKDKGANFINVNDVINNQILEI